MNTRERLQSLVKRNVTQNFDALGPIFYGEVKPKPNPHIQVSTTTPRTKHQIQHQLHHHYHHQYQHPAIQSPASDLTAENNAVNIAIPLFPDPDVKSTAFLVISLVAALAFFFSHQNSAVFLKDNYGGHRILPWLDQRIKKQRKYF